MIVNWRIFYGIRRFNSQIWIAAAYADDHLFRIASIWRQNLFGLLWWQTASFAGSTKTMEQTVGTGKAAASDCALECGHYWQANQSKRRWYVRNWLFRTALAKQLAVFTNEKGPPILAGPFCAIVFSIFHMLLFNVPVNIPGRLPDWHAPRSASPVENFLQYRCVPSQQYRAPAAKAGCHRRQSLPLHTF